MTVRQHTFAAAAAGAECRNWMAEARPRRLRPRQAPESRAFRLDHCADMAVQWAVIAAHHGRLADRRQSGAPEEREEARLILDAPNPLNRKSF